MKFLNCIKLVDRIKALWRFSENLRIVFGLIVALLSIICIVMGGFPLILMSLFLISVGANEYKQFMLNIGVAPFFYIITFISFLILALTIYQQAELIPPIIFLGVFLTFCAILISNRKPYIANISTTILGFLICWLPCHLILLSQLRDNDYVLMGLRFHSGIIYFLILVMAVVATDMGAYIMGTRFGKTKLLEKISPGKTIFGAVSGAICSVIVTTVMCVLINSSVASGVLLGLLITVFAQLGDLSLSVLKRDANLKHSGTLFLSYGGILDRLDSFIFSAPVVYYYVKYIHLIDSNVWFGKIFL